MADRDDRFRPLEGLPGKLYVPRPRGAHKHPCQDCFECQWCSDTRCTACRTERKGKRGGEAEDAEQG